MIYKNNNVINKMYLGDTIVNKANDGKDGDFQYITEQEQHLPDSYVIPFEDNNVKTLCVNNWGGNVVSGELTYGEAKAVTSLGSVFKNKTNITKFNELVYFTGLTTLNNGEFVGCTNMTDIVIPSNVTMMGNGAASGATFSGCTNLSGLTLIDGEQTLNIGMFSCNNSYWMKSNHSSTPMVFPDRPMILHTNDYGNAFSYCDYLTTVYFQSATPPTGLADSDIDNYRKLQTVYCPVGSLSAYQSALDGKNKTVIEYDFDTDPNNVLAREREWQSKVY